MSTETTAANAAVLHRAVAEMRQAHVSQDPFMAAVADWLEQIAGMYPDGHSIGNWHAVAVARAYLGDE